MKNLKYKQIKGEKVLIDEKLMPIVPFPIHVFPLRLQEFIHEVSVSIHVNTTMVSSAVLPIISSAIGNTVRISPKPDWQEPPFIWLIIIEETGKGKSPLIKTLCKNIKRLQAHADKDYRKKCIKRKEKSSGKKDDNNTITGSPVDMPKRRHFFVQDFTIEALTDIFADDPRGTMIYRDELAGMIVSLNQYKKGKGDDREHILELWDASEWKIDRKNVKKYLPNTGTGLIGGIQTIKFTVIFSDDSFDDGLLPRFLMSSSENEPPKFSRETISDSANEWYTQLIDYCYYKEIKFDENDCIESVILELDKEALIIFEEFFNKFNDYRKYVSKRLSTFIPKLISYSLRIAGVLHEIECFDKKKTSIEISKETMTSAIEVTMFFAGQAVKVIKSYDKTGEKYDELQKKLIDALYKLKDKIDNSRLLFSKISETLNSELPEELHIKDNRTVGSMLRDSLNLKTDNAGGKYYLIWEPDKIQELFLEIGLISHISHT